MRLIVVEGHESQRRKLEELLSDLSKKGYVLTGKIETAPVGGWPEIVAASRSGGLFDDKRMVVVEGSEQLGAFPPPLADLLEDEADNIVIAVFAGDSKKTFSGVFMLVLAPFPHKFSGYSGGYNPCVSMLS